jgi:hypothetical protein
MIHTSVIVVWLLGLDGGVSKAPSSSDAAVATTSLSSEDLEIVRNLELLENLESSKDLELLQELSIAR